ncbi:MAG: carbamoyltransferase HypF, partial [Acidimicrobiales bacterium]
MTTVAQPGTPVRHRIRVTGVVQGVGFRPFVYRVATDLGLVGHVGNDSDGVLIDVEGAGPDVARFEARLVAEPPPLARVDAVCSTSVALERDKGQFRIVESSMAQSGVAGQGAGQGRTFVAPDVALCEDCRTELFDPGDRRYRYPFLTCTNCGPRFTITVRLPYDRPNTTMAGFPLCEACAGEYHDPGDRRFHAQPIACAVCGPRLWFEDATGAVEGSDDAVAAVQAALARGEIVAVKGLGGYHLACDATSETAVAELRRRKDRPDKPFAVMVGDVATVGAVAVIEPGAAALLQGPAHPIVLLPTVIDGPLSPLVAPGHPTVGVLLPYTPVHHLLFAPVPRSGVLPPTALVMTSGNLSDEPICYEDADARRRLRHIADSWLLHDRPIHVPCDDSVVRIEDGAELPIRRSRGYAPLPLRLPFAAAPTLATGGELKNTFCVASGYDAWMSQHIGDMGSTETLEAFARSGRQFADMYEVDIDSVAADAHPGYQTRRWAEDNAPGPVILVQHHHAHIAAVMVEHGVPSEGRVIGFAFDGTGYGSDGAIWGGEALVA